MAQSNSLAGTRCARLSSRSYRKSTNRRQNVRSLWRLKQWPSSSSGLVYSSNCVYCNMYYFVRKFTASDFYCSGRKGALILSVLIKRATWFLIDPMYICMYYMYKRTRFDCETDHFHTAHIKTFVVFEISVYDPVRFTSINYPKAHPYRLCEIVQFFAYKDLRFYSIIILLISLKIEANFYDFF